MRTRWQQIFLLVVSACADPTMTHSISYISLASATKDVAWTQARCCPILAFFTYRKAMLLPGTCSETNDFICEMTALSLAGSVNCCLFNLRGWQTALPEWPTFSHTGRQKNHKRRLQAASPAKHPKNTKEWRELARLDATANLTTASSMSMNKCRQS